MDDGRRSPFYMPGDNLIIDDVSGETIRARDARKQWNGLYVHWKRYETRQPQDLVRAIREEIAAPDPRPLVTNFQFVGVTDMLLTEAGEFPIEAEDGSGPLFAEGT